MPPATVTLRHVPLVRVGNWAASVGKGLITADDLQSMMAAAADTEVDQPPIKIGHTGALSKLGDSAPALGWVRNMTVEGDTLYGDLEDVPAQLADILPKAFARRSVEINWNVTTPRGHTYPATIRALALLGVQPPAVKGLADIVDMYQPTAASEGTVSSIELVDATASMFDALDQSRDPNKPTVHDDPNGPSKETPVPEFDPKKARVQLGLAEDASDEEFAKAWDALVEKVKAQEPGEGKPGDGDTGGEGSQGEGAGDGKPAEGEGTGTGAGAGAGEGAKTPELVTLSQSAFAELQGAAKQGVEARQILRKQEIDSIVDTALADGKFTIAEQAEYRSVLESNFDLGKNLVAKLTPGKVPVTALGGSDTEFAELGSEDAIDQALREFFGANEIPAKER